VHAPIDKGRVTTFVPRKSFFFRPLSVFISFSILFSLLSPTLFLKSPANAANVTDGSCTATVSDSTGVSVLSSSGYCYVAFKSTSVNPTWTVPNSIISINYIVVAGGGGGATRHAGGGGGGGVVTGSLAVASGDTLTFSVGSGGAGGEVAKLVGKGASL